MSATPGRSGLHRGAGERAWWLVLVVVAVALVVLAWGPWQQRGTDAGAAPVPAAAESAIPAAAPVPDVTTTAEERIAAQSDEALPQPTLTETANTRAAMSAAPAVPTGVFDDETALGLFLSTEQLAAAVPAASDAATPPEYPADPWGLTPGSTVAPVQCLVAVTVDSRQPVGYATRSWTGQQVAFREEVVLLAGPANGRRVFATLVGAVDACPQYRVASGDGTGSVWDAQPAIEGQGLFPSIVQQVSVTDGAGAVQNGYRGHLLVGNAIVTWTARTPGPVTALGPPDALADVVQERALAAVRALG